MAPYNTYQLQDIQAYLSARLYDTSNQFWPLSELTLYINEALQTWNAMTNFWRGDFVFSTAQGITWYDLTAVANTLRPMTATTSSLYPIINSHLLEPISGIVSKQFTSVQESESVLFRENEVISECAPTVNVSYYPATNGRIQLADGVIDVRRIAYLPATSSGGYGSGAYGIGPYGLGAATSSLSANILWRDDTWAEQSFDTGYTVKPSGIPFVYLMSTEPPISFDTDAFPGYGGQYEILYTFCNPLSVIPVPNDWIHVIKWGALAYMLSTESNAKDSFRAQYCERRYQLGKKLLGNASSILALRVNNIPIQIDSVTSGDQYNPRWQSQVPGTPTNAYQSGLNLIGLAPVPWNLYSITATVVQNAPLPVLPNDYVQVSQDVLNVILDYAQHLASFKMGGAEFAATMPLLKNFLSEAMVYNSRLKEMGEYTDFLLGISQLDERRNPRVAVTADGETG